VSDSTNKHIHMDVSIKFEIKSLIVTYESEDRITDYSVSSSVSRLVTYRQYRKMLKIKLHIFLISASKRIIGRLRASESVLIKCTAFNFASGVSDGAI